jgi:hypothetical protein
MTCSNFQENKFICSLFTVSTGRNSTGSPAWRKLTKFVPFTGLSFFYIKQGNTFFCANTILLLFIVSQFIIYRP